MFIPVETDELCFICRMSPLSRQTIGQPPPLISTGGVHHPHLQQMKKEASHAGGSILQGTSASHSQQPPNRYDFVTDCCLDILLILNLLVAIVENKCKEVIVNPIHSYVCDWLL